MSDYLKNQYPEDFKAALKKDIENIRNRPKLSLIADLLNNTLPASLSVPKEVLKIELSGRRCILLQDIQAEESDGMYGAKIIIPDSARSPLGAGWIVNIGMEWALPGQSDERSTFYGMFDDRWEVIGKKVLFGDYVGQDLCLSLTDRRFQTKFKVLAEHEVWGLVERS